MGKALIIPDVDWSNNNIGQVTFVTDNLIITGPSEINGNSVYKAYYGGESIVVTWELSDYSVASLSNTSGSNVTITPIVDSGVVTLSAIYGDEIVSLTILLSKESFITQDSIDPANMLYQWGDGAKTKYRGIFYLSVAEAESWTLNLNVKAGSTIKVGVQYHDREFAKPLDQITVGNNILVSWDSGWILPGSSVTATQDNNKSNTIGTANSTNKPTAIALVFTVISDETTLPTYEMFIENVTFKLELK